MNIPTFFVCYHTNLGLSSVNFPTSIPTFLYVLTIISACLLSVYLLTFSSLTFRLFNTYLSFLFLADVVVLFLFWFCTTYQSCGAHSYAPLFLAAPAPGQFEKQINKKFKVMIFFIKKEKNE